MCLWFVYEQVGYTSGLNLVCEAKITDGLLILGLRQVKRCIQIMVLATLSRPDEAHCVRILNIF